MKKEAVQPKAPKKAKIERKPIDVITYYKGGRMVKGYRRRKPGDAIR